MEPTWAKRFERNWPKIEQAGLRVVAALAVLVGLAWLVVALDPRAESSVASEFRPFGVALGLVTVTAGALCAARRREDLVVSILGGLTGASFAVGVALSTRPETTWSIFYTAAVFGGLLFGVLVFRGGFRRIQPADEIERGASSPDRSQTLAPPGDTKRAKPARADHRSTAKRRDA